MPSAASFGSVSSAGPRRSSTRSATPARAKLARATSACLGFSSSVTRPATGGQGAGEPDGAVAGEGADFEYLACAVDAGDEVEELALGGGDLNLGHAGGDARLDNGIERGVRRQQGIGDVAVDGVPLVLWHGGPPVRTNGGCVQCSPAGVARQGMGQGWRQRRGGRKRSAAEAKSLELRWLLILRRARTSGGGAACYTRSTSPLKGSSLLCNAAGFWSSLRGLWRCPGCSCG